MDAHSETYIPYKVPEGKLGGTTPSATVIFSDQIAKSPLVGCRGNIFVVADIPSLICFSMCYAMSHTVKSRVRYSAYAFVSVIFKR